MFNAVGIEHSFALLTQSPVGQRGLPFDADVFRFGDPKSIADALESAANAVESRLKSFAFKPADRGAGRPEGQLAEMIESIRRIASEMKGMQSIQRDDYRWIIIGSLVLGIHALLVLLGV